MKKLPEQNLETDLYSLCYRDGILICRWKEVIVDMKACLRLLKDRTLLQNGKDCLFLADARNVKYWTSPAKKFASDAEYCRGYRAVGILVTMSVQRIFTNFFMNFYTQPIPVKAFEKEDDVLNWLKKFGTEETKKIREADQLNCLKEARNSHHKSQKKLYPLFPQ